KRRQTEALIQRWEYKNLGVVIEDAQYIDRHEPKKTNIVLHCALDHGAPQVRMLGKLVADDDQLQVGEIFALVQFRLERGEGFDNSADILVRLDISGVEQERIVDLVAFRDQLAVGVAAVAASKAI